MLIDDTEAFVAALQDDVGGDLRAVAEYDADGYDVRYARDDIKGRLPSVAPELHEDLVLQGIGKERLEDLLDAGALHCSMHRFDDLMAFHFVAGAFSGLFVSVDADTDIPLKSFARTCESQLE